MFQVDAPKKEIIGEATLPGSKSECNRALIMQALSLQPFEIINFSNSDDSIVLKRILSIDIPSNKKEINAGPAGTALRFLTAYLAITAGNWILTGTHRMLERPIEIAVDALNALGADISYLGKYGFPPLKIVGKELTKNKVEVSGLISSQYISALLMIAPTLPNGLEIHIKDKLLSRPYVEMTLKMMQELSVEHIWEGNNISIKPQAYTGKTLYIGPDWSAASYWYAAAAFSDKANIKLKGLKYSSLQGDCIIADLMNPFGVQTVVEEDGILLKRKEYASNLPQEIDFSSCPDLAQTMAVVCAGLGHSCTFIGIDSLKIKETDRIQALRKELMKFNVRFEPFGAGFRLDASDCILRPQIINTYNDHRMAMAFAPLALKTGCIQIKDPEVVSKSYPSFWADLKKIGLQISDI